MSTSQRVSRGFHRLGLCLAAIPILLGVVLAMLANKDVNDQLSNHQSLLCAHEYIQQHGEPRAATLVDLRDGTVSLKPIGCSNSDYDRVKLEEARDPPDFSWTGTFLSSMTPVVFLTLVLMFAVYGVVRAIGWVIGGFAAS